MTKIDERTSQILRDFHLDPQRVLWNCHGTMIMLHRYVEQIAAIAKVRFDPPQVIEADTEKKIAVVYVVGHMDDRSEWSTGEASPANNKNSYPWAMAEKRAKDRVVLKLVGLSGFVYTEDDVDDIVATAEDPDFETPDEWQGFALRVRSAIEQCASLDDLKEVWKSEASDLAVLKLESRKTYQGLVDAKDARKEQLTKQKEAA